MAVSRGEGGFFWCDRLPGCLSDGFVMVQMLAEFFSKK